MKKNNYADINYNTVNIRKIDIIDALTKCSTLLY